MNTSSNSPDASPRDLKQPDIEAIRKEREKLILQIRQANHDMIRMVYLMEYRAKEQDKLKDS